MIQVRRVRMLLELYLIFGRLSYSGVSKVTWGFMLKGRRIHSKVPVASLIKVSIEYLKESTCAITDYSYRRVSRSAALVNQCWLHRLQAHIFKPSGVGWHQNSLLGYHTRDLRA